MSEMEVKKSRFLGYATHADNWDDATTYLEQVKAEHPKARHWCYGFQCGYNPVHQRCSDDGEPTGTAGAPILGAIKGERLSNVVCVVVRYFGGVKLGAGGLIRAYGSAARQVLREAPVDVLIPKTTLQVSVMSENVGAIYDVSSKIGGSTRGEVYGPDGSLSVKITCNLDDAERLRKSLIDATRGSVQFLEQD